MADLKILYVNSDGFYQEHSESADSVKFLSFKTANKELTDAKLSDLIDGADANDQHIHDARYFRENEFISSSAGVADANKPAKTNAGGYVNDLINVSSLNSALDHGALTGLGDDDHTQYILANGTRAFTGAQSMGGFKITNLANPTAGTDAVNLQTLQSYQEGLKPKQAVRVATTANINLASAPASIDGVTLSSGNRVLVKDQTLPEANGIYIFNGAASAMTRATDFDSLSPLDEINGAYTFAQEGTANAGKGFVQTGTVATLGTDPINFVFFNAATSITASTGLVKVGNDIQIDPSAAGAGLGFSVGVLSVNVDNATIEINTDTLRVKADGINDTHIDFGTGANQVSAVDIPIADAGNFTAQTEVEGALQELYSLIAASGVSYTVGVGGVTAGRPCYVSGNNTVLEYGALTGTQRIIGVAYTTETAAATVKVLANDTVVAGVLSGFTAGQTVYWNGSGFTSSVPSGSGSHVWKLGVAKNTTDLHVEVEFIKKNA
jgi:hypothetical protein